MKIAFLHTAQVHVETFETLIHSLAPDAECVHHVAPELLARAQVDGVAAVADATSEILNLLGPADAVVCTCSTLGPLADAVSLTLPNVIRVDRPLMETACATGRNIMVTICLESTREATLALLEDCAEKQGTTVAPNLVICDRAWPFFEKADQAGFATSIVTSIHAEIARSGKPDCIVLAQASMRVASDALEGLGVPILSSPQLATRRAIEIAMTSTDGSPK